MTSDKPDGIRRRRRRFPGRRAVLGAVGLTLSALALGIPPAAAAPAASHHRPNALPAPPQIQALDFMLGRYECRAAGQPDSPVRVKMHTRRELDNHYYYAEHEYYSSAGVPDTHSMGIYGWNPVAGKLILQYHDTWGSSGTGSSPGWQDGHLRFAGQVTQVAAPSATGVAPGFPMGLSDDWQIVDGDHFTLSQTATLPNGMTITNAFDCRRPD